MSKRILVLGITVGLLWSGTSRADFKYTERAQMTGGTMAGMMKMVGAFSKEAKKANQPTESSVAVKGNRLRRDESDGKVSIIDLEGRRIIELDSNKRTYTSITFDQMRAALESAKAKAAAAQQRRTGAQNAHVTMTPKVETSETGNTRTILNLPAKEYKIKMEMQMQSDDPRAKGQSMTTWFNSNSWVAASVPGYDEIAKFYQKMATELNWLPGEIFGAAGAGGMQMNMSEFKKQTVTMKGFPLLQYTSMGMGGTGMEAAGASSSTPAQSSQSTSQPMNPADALAKGVGGLLGGFGKKKKKDQSADQSQAGSSGGSVSQPAPPGTPGSLMDITTEVTSFSSSSLDSSLFEIPAGYTQVQANPDEMLSPKSKK